MAGSAKNVDRSMKFWVMTFEIGFPLPGLGYSLISTPWGVRSVKLHTHIPFLFTKDKQFHSFGDEAETKYWRLECIDEHRDWFFYKDLDLGRVRTTMTDVNGKTMSSKAVIAAMIRYCHDKLIGITNARMCGLRSEEMTLVIVIPVNLTYETKMAIIEAAQETGVERENLRLVSRPRAYLTYCQHLLKEESKMEETKHMIIIDLQDSTAEVHVFEKKSDGSFTCVAQSIRDTRSVSYRHQMHQWLRDTLGQHVYDKICREDKDTMLQFDEEVDELFIRLPGSFETVTLRMPCSIPEFYNWETGEKMRFIVGNDVKLWVNDKVRFGEEFIKKACKSYIDLLTSMIEQVIQDGDVRGPWTHLYFVGTFSKCRYITEATSQVLINRMCGVSPRVVENPDLAALYGGNFIGRSPPQRIRVTRHTYSVLTGRLLKTLLRRGQYLDIGPTTTMITVPTKVGQTLIVLKVIATSRERPMFEDAATDKHIGSISIDVPSSATSRKIDVEISLEVLGAELTVIAKEMVSQRYYVRSYAYEK